MNYLDELNDVQKDAVTTINGPVLVIAGPGSGKTRVLTFRIAHLIESDVAPYSILALTFTNKAAKEMKERIRSVVGDRARLVWAGTFHSIFARILRVEADKIGYPSNFTIYDTQDTQSVISNIVREMGLDPKVYAASGIRVRISSAKSNLISAEAYRENEALREQDRGTKRPYLYRIYSQYVARCKRSGAMDFDDLLYQTYLLFRKNPENVLAKYRERFRFLMVDEFQDTNYLQYSIIRKLVNYPESPKNICVVGDDAQSIYAFRGATIQNILDFQKHYPDLKLFKLEQNYRSTKHIVQAANTVITFNKKQIPKSIWSAKDSGERIKLIKTVSDTEEGKRIADMILEQKTRHHLKNKQIAILYRTNAQSRIFEEFLRRHNILYKVYGGLSFYQRKEIKDVIAYLRLIINPKDEEALRRVLNYPKRGIGRTTIEKISKIADDEFQTMWEVISAIDRHGFTARVVKPTGEFVKLIKAAQKKAENQDAYEIASEIIDKSGVVSELKKDNTIEGLNRYENVQSLLDGIKEFVDSDEVVEGTDPEDKSLSAYLQNIALLTDFDTNTDNDDHVSLMSVHSAKGLEFPSVFVVGLEEQLFPSYMAMQSFDGLDEERRLFYVAITRAERFLTLSYAKSRYRFGNVRFNDPSRFIEEISLENIEMGSRGHISPGGLGGGVQKSKTTGPLKMRNLKKVKEVKPDPNFQPSKAEDIMVGQSIQHLRFGKGKVLSLEGAKGNQVATIFFEEVGQKRIMLKFAKLQIL
ncbi:MAG: UvrD-helicase domain-containing protein [Bacteroidota bacterium]